MEMSTAAVNEQSIIVKTVTVNWKTAGHAMKIVYFEEDDILFIEFSKGTILRDESVSWNINIGYTADGIGEITILDARNSGIYPLQIERVVADAA